MADNIENRLEQLTQAIKGLYAKSSGSQGEVFNALNSLSQRYENLTSVSSEKIASTIVNEFRKTLDIKYSQTNQFIRELEGNLKEFAQNQSAQNPKITAELNRLLNEITNFYTKLSAQEHILQKTLGAIELLRNNDPTGEVVKLSENFLSFSRGFENITTTLNKNFADFLAQIKEFGSKDEVLKIKSEIDIISGNINSVISAISIIDSKYRDLTGLIDTIHSRENIFNDALKEVRSLTGAIEAMKEHVNTLDAKEDIQALDNQIKEQTEALKYEIQKIINTTQDTSIKTEVYNLAQNIESLAEITSNTKEEINSLQSSLSGVDGLLKGIQGTIDTIDAAGFSNVLNDLQEEIKNVQNSISAQNYNNISNNLSDLSGKIENVQNSISDKNNNDVLDGLIEIKSTIAQVQNSIFDKNNNDVLDNLNNLSQEIKNSIAQVQNSLSETISGKNNDDVLNNLSEIRNKIENIENISQNQKNDEIISKLNDFYEKIENIKNIINEKDYNSLSKVISDLCAEVNNVKSLVNDEILYKSHQREAEFEKYLNSAKQDISNLIEGLNTFKQEINALNQGNIKVLQEPIERALESFKNQDIGRDIKDLSDNLKQVTGEIASSISNLQNTLSQMNSANELQTLVKLTESIPLIVQNLENVKNNLSEENKKNTEHISTSFTEATISVKESLLIAIDKIQQDAKSINSETLDILKLDLQRLSDHLIDGVEGLNDKVQKEFIDYKAQFDDFSSKQTDDVEKLVDKLTSLEIGLENYNRDAIDKIQEAIDLNSSEARETLVEIKGDIIESISNLNENNKKTLLGFDDKLDQILESCSGDVSQSLIERKSLRDTISEIENKIERANLQQIHNAKELLEEIQSNSADLSMKISNIEELKNSTSLTSIVSTVSEKLKNLELNNTELTEEVKLLKDHIEQKLKDNVQKIASLVETEPKAQENAQTKPEGNFDNINELSNKIQEYLSNFEFLKNNISQEIKENLTGEFSRLENTVKRLRSADENSNYSYTLEDIESDLTKICRSVEKNAISPEEYRALVEKVVEIRSIAMENVKLNKDTEEELGHLSGWFKDAVVKIDDLSERLDEIQNIGFADLKTRLVQSEKSKNDVQEQNKKIETALKVLIKNARTKDENIAQVYKKIELILKAQAENFNPTQFIDIFYENMTQTKMLSNRVEIIEDKINYIQNAVEKLLSYVEEG